MSPASLNVGPPNVTVHTSCPGCPGCSGCPGSQGCPGAQGCPGCPGCPGRPGVVLAVDDLGIGGVVELGVGVVEPSVVEPGVDDDKAFAGVLLVLLGALGVLRPVGSTNEAKTSSEKQCIEQSQVSCMIK